MAQGELEVRGRVGVLELQAALEGTRGVAGLTEVVVGQPEVEVRARVVGVGLEGLEAAVAHALGEVELQLAALLASERVPAVLAEVVVGGVLGAARRTRAGSRPSCHGSPFAPADCAVKSLRGVP